MLERNILFKNKYQRIKTIDSDINLVCNNNKQKQLQQGINISKKKYIYFLYGEEPDYLNSRQENQGTPPPLPKESKIDRVQKNVL